MSFEYKIITKLTKKHVSEIKQILEAKQEFEKKYEFSNRMFWDFRSSENRGKMPNTSISFENDGICICRYGGGYLWKNLEELKEYIDSENITYTVLDYQE